MKLFVVAFFFFAGFTGFNVRAQLVQPNDVGVAAFEPSVEYLPPAAEAVDTKLDDDGYRYKIVRRLKYRQRRDVPQEYLPPIEEPSQTYLPPAAETKLADDGYRYKTLRKLKYRHRH